MTTLVALNTMNGLVLGCDSLATAMRQFIDPYDLIRYGDADGQMTIGPTELAIHSRRLPYNHMHQVEKLYSLAPLDMGVMFAGIGSIQDRTIQSIVEEFKNRRGVRGLLPRGSERVSDVASELHQSLQRHFNEAYGQEPYLRPELELMVGGYDSSEETACVVRVDVANNRIQPPEYRFGPHVGAQSAELERLLLGTDIENEIKLEIRVTDLLMRYRDLVTRYLTQNGISISLPSPSGDASLKLFSDNWGLEGLHASWGEFSIQTAIDFVDWLVDVMIFSHRFRMEMPTVGGPSQIGVVQKNRGFTYVSKRVWTHDGNVTAIEES